MPTATAVFCHRKHSKHSKYVEKENKSSLIFHTNLFMRPHHWTDLSRLSWNNPILWVSESLCCSNKKLWSFEKLIVERVGNKRKWQNTPSFLVTPAGNSAEGNEMNRLWSEHELSNQPQFLPLQRALTPDNVWWDKTTIDLLIFLASSTAKRVNYTEQLIKALPKKRKLLKLPVRKGEREHISHPTFSDLN